jgi:hypothetical protein
MGDGNRNRRGARRHQRFDGVAYDRLAMPLRELLWYRLSGAHASPGGNDDRGEPCWSGGTHGDRGG